MAYTKAEIEGWVASTNPEERKKVVNILKEEFGMKMSDIVRLQPPERVAKVLELQASKGGAKGKPAATKAAPAPAAGKPAAGKKAAAKPEPEPEPEPEQEEETEEAEAPAGGASLEDIQAAVTEALAPIAELLGTIQELVSEASAAAARAEIMAKQAALAGGFAEEDLDALVSGE